MTQPKAEISFITILLLIFVIVLYISSGVVWYNTFLVGQYYAHCSVFAGVFVGGWPIIGGFLAFFLCRWILRARKAIKQEFNS